MPRNIFRHLVPTIECLPRRQSRSFINTYVCVQLFLRYGTSTVPYSTILYGTVPYCTVVRYCYNQRCAIPRYSTRTSRYFIGISWNSNTFGIPSDFPNYKMLKILLRTSMLRGTLYSEIPYGRTTRFYDVTQVRYCTVRCHRTSILYTAAKIEGTNTKNTH